ncbi:MAG: hypothetical protein U5K38_15920 [Woeseiaceae bacterium]|nr:hypothetical protein [Woeseiaceae bacterium]
MARFPTGLVSVVLLFLASFQSANAGIVWHWNDSFSAGEKAKLQRWITETVAGVERAVAPFPFDVHINFYRAGRGSSPVPWANTIRSRRQGVNFHVNPEHSLAALRSDWTAAHELSHLLVPYVGRRHAWFAEGFASFMQYQVMQELDVIEPDEANSRYRAKITRAKRGYDLHDLPFVDAARTLAARRQYPTMYWGGAVYFLQMDRQLRARGSSMLDVLQQFVDCCRHQRHGFDGLIAELDRIASAPVFSRRLDAWRVQPGFPDASEVWQ